MKERRGGYAQDAKKEKTRERVSVSKRERSHTLFDPIHFQVAIMTLLFSLAPVAFCWLDTPQIVVIL